MSALPFLGAALPSNFLAHYADWLKENQRDLEIQDPIMPEVLDGDWRSLVKNIKSILDGYTGRMGVHGPFLSLTLIGYDPKIRQVVVDRLLQSLEICGELGATHMVVHSPIEFFGTPFLPSRPDFGHPFESQLIAETMMPVVAKAEQIGCKLVIENIWDRHPHIWAGLIRSFGSEYVCASVDTGHAFMQYATHHAPAVDYWMLEAGDKLEHLHLQDTDGYSDRHWAPGEGDLNWHAIFAALRELKQSPRLILELADYHAIPRAVSYLNGLGLAQ